MKETISLQIAPTAEVKRDIRRNIPWIFGVLLCSFLYLLISSLFISRFENWHFLHACYFTTINMTTVGFGDVVPTTHLGKVLAGINGFVGVLFFGVLVAVITIALQPASWSTTLTTDKSPEDSVEHKYLNDDSVQHTTAALFESLAKILRTTDRQEQLHNGVTRVRIQTHGNRISHVLIDIFIDQE